MTTYYEGLTAKGINVPDCYKQFLQSEEFPDYSGMVLTQLDHEAYSETTAVQFDWDEYMLTELLDEDLPEIIPIAILEDTEVVDDAYLAIKPGDESCAVFLCEVDEETQEVSMNEIASSFDSLLESLEHPEDNYITYLETKFDTTLPERYKNFLQSYEYVDYNGKLKCDEDDVWFDEFPHLQWAAETYNNGKLEWLPIASLGEDASQYDEALVIKMGDENCPVFVVNEDERIIVSDTLSNFLSQ